MGQAMAEVEKVLRGHDIATYPVYHCLALRQGAAIAKSLHPSRPVEWDGEQGTQSGQLSLISSYRAP